MLHPRQWCDDRSAVRCVACADAFSLWRCRRHHCRHCGNVFCDACTQHRLWLRPLSHATLRSAVRPTPTFPLEEGEERAATAPSMNPASDAPFPFAAAHLGEPSLFYTAQESVNRRLKHAFPRRPSTIPAYSEGSGIAAFPALVQQGKPSQRILNPSPVSSPRDSPELQPCTAPKGMASSTAAVGPRCEDRLKGSPTLSKVLSVSSTPSPSSPTAPLAEWQRSDYGIIDIRSAQEVTATPPPSESSTAAMPTALESQRPPDRAGYPYGTSPSEQDQHCQDSLPFPPPYPITLSKATKDAVSPKRPASAPVVGLEHDLSPTPGDGDRTTTTKTRQTTDDIFLLSGRGQCSFQREEPPPSLMKGSGRACSTSLPSTDQEASLVEPIRCCDRSSMSSDGHLFSHAGCDVEEDTYRRESFRSAFDQALSCTWYLCRVCTSCNDRLLACASRAHPIVDGATGGTVVDRAPQDDSTLSPLESYVRCYSPHPHGCNRSTRGVHASIEWQQHQHQRHESKSSWSPFSNALHATTREISSTKTPPPRPSSSLSGATLWECLISAVAKPMVGMQIATASRVAAHPTPRSLLSPRVRRIEDGAPADAEHKLRTATPVASTPRPLEVGTNPARSRRRDHSLVSFVTVRPDDVSALSLSATSFLDASQLNPAQQPSPARLKRQQQHLPSPSKAVAASPATSIRSRVVSIDSSATSFCQAVALARRRRRVAVILVDERNVTAATSLGEDVSLTRARCKSQSEHLTVDRATPPPVFPSVHMEMSSLVDNGSCSASEVSSAAPASSSTTKDFEGRPPHCALAKADNGYSSPMEGDREDTSAQVSSHPPDLSLTIIADTLSGMGKESPLYTAVDALSGQRPRAWLLPALSPKIEAPASPAVATATKTGAEGTGLTPAELSISVATHHRNTSASTMPLRAGGDSTPAHSSHPISCAPTPQRATSPSLLTTRRRSSVHASTVPSLSAQRLPPASGAGGREVLRDLLVRSGASIYSGATGRRLSAPKSPIAGAAPSAPAPSLRRTPYGDVRSDRYEDARSKGGASKLVVPRWCTTSQPCLPYRESMTWEAMGPANTEKAAAMVSPFTFALANVSATVAASTMMLSEAAYQGSAVAAPSLATSRRGLESSSAARRKSLPCSGGSPTDGWCERATVPASVFLHLQPSAHSNSSSTVAAADIKAVTTQVDVVGFPIALSRAPQGQGTGAIAGVLPFNEFLSQLTKISTNIDGYVLLLLRSRNGSNAHDCSPSTLDGNAQGVRGSATWDSMVNVAKSSMRSRCREADVQFLHPFLRSPRPTGGDEGFVRGASVSLSVLNELPTSSSLPSPRERSLRRPHVVEWFGGSHLRLLYQQLQNCGVTNPAISVVEVVDAVEGSAGNYSRPSPDETGWGTSRYTELADDAELSSPQPEPAVSANVAAVSHKHCPSLPLSPGPLRLPLLGTGDAVEAFCLPSPLRVAPDSASTSIVAGGAIDLLLTTSCSLSPTTSRACIMAEGQMSASQTQAITSLHTAARELGVVLCSAPSASTPRMQPANGEPSEPAPVVSSSLLFPHDASVAATPAASPAGSTTRRDGVSGGWLSRGIDALVATLVYRDVYANQAP